MVGRHTPNVSTVIQRSYEYAPVKQISSQGNMVTLCNIKIPVHIQRAGNY